MSKVRPPFLPGLPLIGNMIEFRRDPVACLRSGYERLGSVFAIRLGPICGAVLIGPEYERVFFEQTDRALSMSDVYRAFEPVFGKGFTLAVPLNEYKEQRRLLRPVFEASEVSRYVQVAAAKTMCWLDKLGDYGEFELCRALEELALEVNATALLGGEFREAMGDEFFRLYRDVVSAIEVMLPPNLPLSRFRRRDRAREELHARIRTLLAQRRSKASAPDDMLQRLATARDTDGRPLPDSTLASMILFLVFSASESTPLQCAWMLIQLLQNRPYLETVLAELGATAVSRESMSDCGNVARLSRLDWAFSESVRMKPMTTMLWRRCVAGYDIGGYHIPKGWLTIISPAVSQRLSSEFRDPDTYKPERFASGPAHPRVKCGALTGFGGGRHHCPGVRFAAAFCKVAVGLLLTEYSLSLATPNPCPDYSTMVARPTEPCLVSYRRLGVRERARVAVLSTC